eukprot:gene32262-16828_t
MGQQQALISWRRKAAQYQPQPVKLDSPALPERAGSTDNTDPQRGPYTTHLLPTHGRKRLVSCNAPGGKQRTDHANCQARHSPPERGLAKHLPHKPGPYTHSSHHGAKAALIIMAPRGASGALGTANLVKPGFRLQKGDPPKNDPQCAGPTSPSSNPWANRQRLSSQWSAQAAQVPANLSSQDPPKNGRSHQK